MKSSIIKLVILIVSTTSIFNYGCGGSSATFKEAKLKPIKNIQTIYKPFDAVWDKTVEWFAFHNSPIKVLDKSSGLIASEYSLSVSQSKDYLDCGKAISGQTNFQGTEVTTLKFENQKGNFNVLIRKIDSTSTKVTINFFSECDLNQYNSYDGQLVYSQKINCYSTGILEKEIFDDISK